jgi:hypothetical protein
MDIEMLNVQTIMFDATPSYHCICCGEISKFGVVLAETAGTFYLPNQHARTAGLAFNNLKEVWFCKDCVGAIERRLNAFVKNSRKNTGLPPLEPPELTENEQLAIDEEWEKLKAMGEL